MNYELICVGTLKEQYWKDAAAEYRKRLSRFGKVEVVELREAPLRAGASAADEAAAIRTEGEAILRALSDGKRGYVIVLDGGGEDLSSEAFAKKLSTLSVEGVSRVRFIIGGSLGLSDAVKQSADKLLSFGRKTLPHRLMRIVLLEQIYRACKISANETYHK
jgi:23S rRNA (pseudouridine1915-N3)-methyltransferase